MSQVVNTLPTQETQSVTATLQSIINGLSKSNNFYSLVETHAGEETHVGDKPRVLMTMSHELNKNSVSAMCLRESHCEIIFRPNACYPDGKTLCVPYSAIDVIYHSVRVKPKNARLYCAEHYKGNSFERTLSRQLGLAPA